MSKMDIVDDRGWQGPGMRPRWFAPTDDELDEMLAETDEQIKDPSCWLTEEEVIERVMSRLHRAA